MKINKSLRTSLNTDHENFVLIVEKTDRSMSMFIEIIMCTMYLHEHMKR